MSDYSRGQGVVSPSGRQSTRQVFFPLTAEALEMLDERGTEGLYSSFAVELDLDKYLSMLPEMEAEIVHMLFVLRKSQKSVALLLNTSQPTVSYRFRRAIQKLSYLMALHAVPLKELVDEIPKLKDKEKEILLDLFYLANQELVGSRNGVRQSSVKWIFVKARRYVAAAERSDPEQWNRHHVMLMFLERHLRMRIFS